MKRVGFVLKREKIEAVAIARELVAWLVARGFQPVAPAEHEGVAPGLTIVPRTELGTCVDLLVVLGGDGTLLHGASLVAEAGVPVLGVNLGRLGFLVPFDPGAAQGAIAQALEGRLEVEERMRLRVLVHRVGAAPVERYALNDAVISQGALARLIELLARVDAQRITLYKADGLIVATPTGSTAYNLAAGGPILVPWQAAMALTPICPHTLTNRPLVLPGQSVLEVEVVSSTDSVTLTVDGQWGQPIYPGDRVEITRASKNLRVYRSDKTYFEILRSKLRWGERESEPC